MPELETPASYRMLDSSTVSALIASLPQLGARLGGAAHDWHVHEVGDGNLNLVFIVQGASDPRVPAGESIQIHDALAKKGVPCDLTIFPDEGHGAQKRENRVTMLAQAIAFFTKHLVRGE